MKIACDLCETIEDIDHIKEWEKVDIGDYVTMRLCKDCTNKLFNFLEENTKKSRKERNAYDR